MMNKMYESSVMIPTNDLPLQGDLKVPENSKGLIIYLKEKGECGLSPEHCARLAAVLNGESIATLAADVLISRKSSIKSVLDIELLAGYLVHIAKWCCIQPLLKHLPLGYFGTGLGAAAALWAAALQPDHVQVAVTLNGRLDLARAVLSGVKASVLLLASSLDEAIVELNDEAFELMQCHRELKILWGASTSFKEEGKLEEASHLAAQWLDEFLVPLPHSVHG